MSRHSWEVTLSRHGSWKSEQWYFAFAPLESSTLPPPGPNRLQFGQTLLSQALVELKIGFGHDGGEAGQSVRFAMTELEREREMMMRAAGRR